MTDGELCFCGSGKPHVSCHPDISETSFVARLYRLERELDREMEEQKRTRQLSFPCGPGCGECCSQCFCVSETEFVQILHYVLTEWGEEELVRLIDQASVQWESLKASDPETARKLDGPVTLRELFETDRLRLPFPCLFLTEDRRCSIYPVRPVACRIHGTGYTNRLIDRKPCSLLPRLFSDLNRYADLTGCSREISRFVLVKFGSEYIVRRPVPLFYYFQLVFADRKLISRIPELDFYKDLTRLDEDEYVRALIKTGAEEPAE